MRVGFFQFAPELGKTEANLARVEAALRGTAADLVVLPELFSTGYCFSSRAELAGFAEDLTSGPTTALAPAPGR